MANLNFGVEMLSRAMGMNRTQLYRKLKALSDQSPVGLINMIRLKRAAALLSAGAGNVGEVSFAVGFREHSYFSKCFHKQYGMTPSEYMAELAKQ